MNGKNRLGKIISCVAATAFALTPMLSGCAAGDGSKEENSGGEWKDHEHKYEAIETERATCEEGGKIILKCECGDIKSEEKTAPLGHEWGSYIYNENAGCTVNGTETAECIRCGKTDTREKINTKTGHEYGEYVYNNDATCTEDGTETATCKRCGETVTRIKTNTAHGHNIKETRKDATCTEDGYITAKCLLCDYYKYEIINSEGHKYKYGVCEKCDERDRTTPTEGLKYENNTVTRGEDDIMKYIVIVIAEENSGKRITEICAEAFLGCEAEEIVIPDGIRTIGESAFEGCEKLKEFRIPEGVEEIKFGTFYGCAELTKITIPTSVQYIDELAFEGCDRLTVYYEGTEEQWSDIYLCEDWGDIPIVCMG